MNKSHTQRILDYQTKLEAEVKYLEQLEQELQYTGKSAVLWQPPAKRKPRLN